MLHKLQTKIICPNCKTELDISNLKDAIIEEIYRILKENKEKL